MTRRSPTDTRETALVQSILGVFKHYPTSLFVWRNNTGQCEIGGRTIRFGKKGSSDILGCVRPRGRLIGLEAKSPTGKLSKAQHEWLTLIIAMGGYACVVRSVQEALNALVAAMGGQPSPVLEDPVLTRKEKGLPPRKKAA